MGFLPEYVEVTRVKCVHTLISKFNTQLSFALFHCLPPAQIGAVGCHVV